jgi:acyl transferase domain-containing protein
MTEKGSVRETIAIVGIGCRYPGARGPQELWKLLLEGTDLVTPFSEARKKLGVLGSNPEVQDKLYVKQAGQIADVESFDAQFFGISPREAIRLDPQTRLLLEVTWEAMEDSGTLSRSLAGTRTGLFVGTLTSDYELLVGQNIHQAQYDLHTAVGVSRAGMAGHIAHALDLQGPAVTLDAACSSSLVAIHLASRELLMGGCDIAFAGGVNVLTGPLPYIAFCGAGALSPDGRCKAFDATANGFVRSDGAGVVMLKRLSDALRDGDQIYATVMGTGMSHDGSTTPFMQPSPVGQQRMLEEALRDSGVAAKDLFYVEAHGTGTPVGDPIEAAALGKAVGIHRPKGQPLRIGSIKSNVGHTEGAAGVAGVIKVALSLKHGMLAPSIHCANPNPKIPWEALNLSVQRTAEPLPADARYAGVSSFGITGVNVHAVLARYDPKPAQPAESGEENRLVLLSAHTPSSLQQQAADYGNLLRSPESPPFADVTHTLALHRTHQDQRLSFYGTRSAAAEALEGFGRGERGVSLFTGNRAGLEPKVTFVFPGQGWQWVGMGKGLAQRFPVFAEAVRQCQDTIAPWVKTQLLEIDHDDAGRAALEDVNTVQPMLFTFQVAMARLWMSFGITPHAVIGHSMGEVAAAHIAGALTLEDAARIICERSQLAQRLNGRGAMLMVDAAKDQIVQVLGAHVEKIDFAAFNGPRSTVLSGPSDAIAQAAQLIEAQQIFSRQVKVRFASHSREIDTIRDDLFAALAPLKPTPFGIEFYSTARAKFGRRREDGAALTAEYWWENMRNPVQFLEGVTALVKHRHDTMIEMSAHPILLSAVGQTAAEHKTQVTLIPSDRRESDEVETLSQGLASAYAAGCSPDLTNLVPGQKASLPPYRWTHERFWIGDEYTHSQRAVMGHALLGESLALATSPNSFVWQQTLELPHQPWLLDHQVDGVALYPGAAYLEMMLSAVAERFGACDVKLLDVSFRRGLFLRADRTYQLQTVLTRHGEGGGSLKIFARAQDTAAADGATTKPTSNSWELLTTSDFEVSTTRETPVRVEVSRVAAGGREVQRDELYGKFREHALEYGPAFQGLQSVRIGDNEALGAIQAPTVLGRTPRFVVHPAMLDACVQASLPLGLSRPGIKVVWGGVKSLWASVPGAMTPRYAKVTKVSDDSQNLELLSEDGSVLLRMEGVFNQVMETSITAVPDEKRLEVAWVPVPPSFPPPAAPYQNSPSTWLLFEDYSGVGRDLEANLIAKGHPVIAVRRARKDMPWMVKDGVIYLPEGSPEAYEQLATHLKNTPLRGVVHLWSLDVAPQTEPHAVIEDAQLSCMTVTLLVRTLASLEHKPRLSIITRGGQPVDDQPTRLEQAPLWGLGRTLLREHPELNGTLIDLSPQVDRAEVGGVMGVLLGEGNEQQIAMRGDQWFAARLVADSPATARVRPLALVEEANSSEVRETNEGLELSSDRVYQLSGANQTPNELAVIEVETPHAGSDEVVVQIEAAAPNTFALQGISGWSGRVLELGSEVRDLAIGAEVVGFTFQPIASRMRIAARQLASRPRVLSAADAASVATHFPTALYALHSLAHLQQRERVLIHGADLGLGLALVSLARSTGAEIWATASDPASIPALTDAGATRVFDVSSITLARDLRGIAGDHGPDVLCIVSGEPDALGGKLVGPGGRVVDLRRQDRDAVNRPLPRQGNWAYFALDFEEVAQRTSTARQLLTDVLHKAELQAIALPKFSSVAVHESLQLPEPLNGGATPPVLLLDNRPPPTLRPKVRFAANGRYLISGGAGSMGLAAARALQGRGAGHLVLLGRSKPDDRIHDAIRELTASGKASGFTAEYRAVDVVDADALSKVVDELSRAGQPVRGVIHTAGVLDDGILLQLTPDKFRSVMRPKIQGAWNLQQVTLAHRLDFFVVFSSIASVMGAPGQANYAAANAMLDAFAHARSRQGRPTLSINWGWVEGGLTAQAERVSNLHKQGIQALSPDDAMQRMLQMMDERAVQTGIANIRFDQMMQAVSGLQDLAFFENMKTPASSAPKGKHRREEILSADPGERMKLMVDLIAHHLGQVLRQSTEKLDVNRAIIRMGVDSLMAVELKNRIERELNASVSVPQLLGGVSIVGAAELLLTRIVEAAAPSASAERMV